MKILIVWDTKRENRATQQLVKWMIEYLTNIHKIEVKAIRPNETPENDFDLVIVGSPIYYEKPMSSIIEFLKTHSKILHDKKFAIFILGWANKIKRFKNYVDKKYVGSIKNNVPGDVMPPIGKFNGWIRKKDEKQKDQVEIWLDTILKNLG